jgi:hypothetical protein
LQGTASGLSVHTEVQIRSGDLRRSLLRTPYFSAISGECSLPCPRPSARTSATIGRWSMHSSSRSLDGPSHRASGVHFAPKQATKWAVTLSGAYRRPDRKLLTVRSMCHARPRRRATVGDVSVGASTLVDGSTPGLLTSRGSPSQQRIPPRSYFSLCLQLQTAIADVPTEIRAQAKLAKNTITKIIFAYAHKAFESPNIESELKTVQSLLGGLDLTKGVEIEVVELKLRTIEELYLTSRGSIQVTFGQG